jgi:hypothetical protein
MWKMAGLSTDQESDIKFYEAEQWRCAAVQHEEEDRVGGFCGRRLHEEKTYYEGNTLLCREHGI